MLLRAEPAARLATARQPVVLPGFPSPAQIVFLNPSQTVGQKGERVEALLLPHFSVCTSSPSGNILYPFDTLKVAVLSPHSGAMRTRCSKDHAIRQWQL